MPIDNYQKFMIFRPILAILSGVYLSIAGIFYFVVGIPLAVGIATLVAAIVCLSRQHFLIAGLLAGLAAMSLNIDSPYQSTFTDCHYQATLQQPFYSHNKRGAMVELAATDVTCVAASTTSNLLNSKADNTSTPVAANTIHLPNQTVQYWTTKDQFRDLGARQIIIRSDLQPVRSRLNPFSFDYERYLLSNSIRLTAKELNIEATQQPKFGLQRLRHAFSEAITSHLSANNSAIILALVTGNRSRLTINQKQKMQQTSTSHVLAISGLHLVLVGGLSWLFFQALWAFSPWLSDRVAPIQAGGVAALVMISGYALLTGFNLPVQRAWLMFCLMIISWLWLRSMSSHSLLLAAVVILLVDPYAIFSVGFYYSFIATYIVLWCMRSDYSPLGKILLMQLLINVTLMPITWWAFGTISFSAFFVNLLIIPWLGLWVLPWAILACCLTLLSPFLAKPFWSLTDFSTTAMWQVIDIFQSFSLNINPDWRPILPIVIITVISMLLALILRKWYFIFGLLTLLYPISFKANPALIIADSRYTSTLIHNGTQAIIINPGYQYKQRNDGEKWQRYLNRYHLSLAAIVLQNGKLNHIAATTSLLKLHPNTNVITLTNVDLPYQHDFCVPLELNNLQLSVNNDEKCHVMIRWFGKDIHLFPTKKTTSLATSESNTILNSSKLIWQSKAYDAQQLGAVTVSNSSSLWKVTSLRQEKRLWRKSKAFY